MAKTRRNVKSWDEEEALDRGFIRENKRQEKRIKRALKTNDVSVFEDEEYDEDGFSW
jgi:hypothetical protein